ncbi:hypothetical protein [Stackebrandtia nassauensis]|uniref:Uncharacterized protein n=1 Tax=Stackebrandtia nassauensis (strain DSM 44728 / CIP 108903 / NRRL B-16338 / NBRC 102104 / LLR-40K-21) TaxID=446470 RepID=D3QAT9_STANL|nr:hypothetical protein [Stackebrandtia nassauensis]ADD44735.1 hypothetical protein Snas_5100 [Stackebrandtia nassauensis DSM 44728]
MENFYVLIGMGMLLAAIVWFVSPRSRWKLRRYAFIAALIALLLALGYHYSTKDDPPGSSSSSAPR